MSFKGIYCKDAKKETPAIPEWYLAQKPGSTKNVITFYACRENGAAFAAGNLFSLNTTTGRISRHAGVTHKLGLKLDGYGRIEIN